MDAQRPFSGPVSVSVAGLALFAISAASFASGLTRHARLQRSVGAEALAHMVAAQPKPAPNVQVATLAEADPVQPQPPVSPKPAHRHHHARAASEAAANASATAIEPLQPPSAPGSATPSAGGVSDQPAPPAPAIESAPNAPP
jgi:hypothetical protein